MGTKKHDFLPKFNTDWSIYLGKSQTKYWIISDNTACWAGYNIQKRGEFEEHNLLSSRWSANIKKPLLWIVLSRFIHINIASKCAHLSCEEKTPT